MAVNVWGYLHEYEAEREEILAAVESVLRSGKLILGPNVAAFEEEFAAYCGAKYGVGCDNGTSAVMLALLALGLNPGDEVVTVANTAVPTVSAIVSAGGAPRFVDIDPATGLMDVSKLEAAITPRTRAVVAVHLFGQCVDMAAVRAVADRHGLFVVEDCAQSHGATQGGRVAGSLADAAAFSFYPTKILGTYGDGGMVLTDRAEVAEKLKRLRFYGMEKTYYALEHGFNSRLDEIHAAILRGKLKHLPGYIARRRELAGRYDAALAGTALTLPATAPGNEHAYYLYVVRHPRRDAVMAGLRERGVNVNISYPWPIHTMTGYAHLGYKEGDLPATEAAAREIFSLPLYPSLTDAEQDTAIAALRETLAGLAA
ncbi:Glutamine--scyllo-inositol transaminase [Solidesulfovibrio carbinoliphilus subsp. oakridgensis]|uniref:Glutamine--scyllo-inositol transaminase n=1 Tax=Solidesulfovibrio carbinoliphilus subsp. oakridgensis TaxID=694327 RepID=G7Q913_9BACT|nr:DegT/DnrJ/EryC1/StrS family aminotransferase [Solidesulfovibrio carbinoliphilus]EHJ47735.1 Glutamine--scyllo-inositol transaminase [Solidesulfovibrio carbinoliphilus subsp. oakridgensis]